MCLNLFLSDAPDPPAELRLTAQLQEGPTQGLVPFSASGLTLGRAGMKQFQKPGCRHLCNKHLLKELLSEFNYSIFLDKWKIFEANDNRQCRAEVRASPDWSPYP